MISQMCTCGATFKAATVVAVWALMDAHFVAVHARPSERESIVGFVQRGGKVKK